MAKSYAGYNDVTPKPSTTNPAGGILIGTSRPLTLALTDEAGDPVSSVTASIVLTIYDPSGNSVTKTGGDLAEIGSTGVYEYENEFDEIGMWVWDWFYDDGTESVRVGSFCKVLPIRTFVPASAA